MIDNQKAIEACPYFFGRASNGSWLIPRDPTENLKWRIRCRERAMEDKSFRDALYQMCMDDVLAFMAFSCWGYDPRARFKVVPFIPYDHQAAVFVAMDEAIAVAEREERSVDVILDKARAQGGTFGYLWVDLRRWLRDRMFSAGYVTRNEDLVDSKTDSNTILWKVAWAIQLLPVWMQPNYERHLGQHTFINKENGSLLRGFAAGQDVAAGGRAAQPLDSSVLTPQGPRLMGEIAPGDFVIGASGKPTKVISVHPLGKKQAFRVRFSDGASTECCDDHLWTVTERWSRDSRKDHNPITKPLRDLRESLRADRGGQKAWNYQIPITSPVEFSENQLKIHPYVLGCLLGDGCFRHSSPTFTTTDEEMAETIGSLLPAGLSMVRCGQIEYRISTGVRRYGQVNTVTDALRDMSLWMKTSHTKFIPNCYKYAASPKNRLELLRGLLDTDGWVALRKTKTSSAKVCYCSVSRQMVEDVRFIVQSLGGVTGMISATQLKGKKYERTGVIDPKDVIYELRIAMPKGMNPFKLSRKKHKYVERSKYQPRRSIVAVEPSRIIDVQCIRVEAEDGLYLTDDCIVTHNTVFTCDEFGARDFISAGKDEEVMAALHDVTNVIRMVSARYADQGVFHEACENPDTAENGVYLVLDWKDHPQHGKHSYIVRDGKPIARKPEDQEAVDKYHAESPNLYARLERKGFKWQGVVRSPWYDMRCLRPTATPRLIASQLDRNPRGATGKCFSPDLLDRMKREHCKPPVWRGTPVFDSETLSLTGLLPRDDGPLKLWFRPGIDHSPPLGPFTAGCDIASGGVGAYASNSVMSALDDRTGEQVLEYATKGLEPRPFARRVVGLCIWLRKALLGWEDSGVSGGFAKEIMETAYYGNVFFRDVTQLGSQKKSRKPGWPCRDPDKADQFEQLALAMETGRCIPRSKEMITECGEYEWDGDKIIHAPTKNKGATQKNHGDRAIAMGGVWLVYSTDSAGARVDTSEETGQTPEYGSFKWREDQEPIQAKTGSPGFGIRDVIGY